MTSAELVLEGDALTRLRELPAASVQTCITSPPYWGLRDYGVAGQLGLEPTPEAYVTALVAVFAEVRRVLRDDGTLWLNLGDSYARDLGKGGSGPNGKHDLIPDYGNARKIMSESKGSSDGRAGRADRAPVRVGGDGLKPKDLVGIPWRVAFALQADGWYLRSDIIWAKPNPMPESVTDRPTKAHEYLFLLSKRERYFYDADAIRETAQHREWQPGRENAIAAYPGSPNRYSDGPAGYPTPESGRNKRSVWTIATAPYPEAHFATFPPDLVKPCVMAGSREGDTVLDPFAGSGTTLYVAKELGRAFVGIELNPAYCELIARRLRQGVLPLAPALTSASEEAPHTNVRAPHTPEGGDGRA